MTALSTGPVRLSVLRGNSRNEQIQNISFRFQYVILL